MTYLLDTNVLAELRHRRGAPAVKAWVAAQHASELSISVITVIEIERGILLRSRTDEAQAAALTAWFEQRVLRGFAGRVLPLDLAAARRVAPLYVPNPAPPHDALIAGTALAHGLTVVSRNVPDFERAGVPVLNPWKGPTAAPGP